MALTSENPEHNIIFIGETGTGKSSAINLLLGTGASARVSNDSQSCTLVSASYQTTLNGAKYILWDTRGLGEGYSFRNIFRFRASSEKELKKFLKERHQRREIDLLVYCVRGSRATRASAKYYDSICAITRHLAAPVVALVTHLEREGDMEDWWNRNSSGLKNSKMEFDGHVCITTLPDHARTAESKKKLVDLITKKRCWEAKKSGSYFGSSVQVSVPSALPHRGGALNFFKAKFKGDVGNHPGTSSSPPLTRHSSYHTAESPGGSVPPSPVVEPPTPRSTKSSPKVPPIDTNFLGAHRPSQPSGEETSSMGPLLYSMPMSSQSSNTSNSEVHLQSCTEECEDHLMSELPFKHSTATVVRRKGYATRQGSFGDIWECDLVLGDSSRMVAVKTVKAGTGGYENLRPHEKKLRRELKVWGRLRHRNIVPLLGIVYDFGPLPSMVSPWFHNGSLTRYLANYESLKVEKLWLLGDIAAGLSYLHSNDVIHGDLHSDNVLIDDHGRACLTDFGLSLINEFVGTSYLNSSICGGVQFADPALVQQVDKSQDHVFYPTKPCDVYSFGGLMLHVLSGKKPYDGLPLYAMLQKVLAGERPRIPTNNKHIIPWHRSLIRRCWNHEECKRPLADDLVRMFARQ